MTVRRDCGGFSLLACRVRDSYRAHRQVEDFLPVVVQRRRRREVVRLKETRVGIARRA